MSSFSEHDIRRAAEIRELLIKEISEKEEELEKLLPFHRGIVVQSSKWNLQSDRKGHIQMKIKKV